MSITAHSIQEAAKRISSEVVRSDLTLNERLSAIYGANVFLKKEHQQKVRSYKIRGALNFMSMLTDEEKERGVVCASAGNHSQGFAYSTNHFGINGVVFMPANTPPQKQMKTLEFGNGRVQIILSGPDFDTANESAIKYAQENSMVMVPPFDDERIMAGQGTVGLEIMSQYGELAGRYGSLDTIIVPVGGGGLISGIAVYVKETNPQVRIVGVETQGAPAMYRSLQAGHPVTLETIDTLVSGMAVKSPGRLTYEMTSRYVGLENMMLVKEGEVCKELVDYFNHEGEVVELAGVASIAALGHLEIKGKNVVCVISGGNSDFGSYTDVEKRALKHQHLLGYFQIDIPDVPKALEQVLECRAADTNMIRMNYEPEIDPRAMVAFSFPSQQRFDEFVEGLEKLGWSYQIMGNGSK